VSRFAVVRFVNTVLNTEEPTAIKTPAAIVIWFGVAAPAAVIYCAFCDTMSLMADSFSVVIFAFVFIIVSS